MTPDKSGLELVLVEDNQNDIELFLNVVDWIAMDDKVRVFPDGREALEFLLARGTYKDDPPQVPVVVFLDLKMPFVDGIEVLKTMRSDERTSRIPVVIFSSSNQECDVIKSYELGANSYVVKPVQFDKFAETIRNLITYWRNTNHPVTSQSD